MWCFSCFKSGPSQDDLQIEKAIEISLADEQARIRRERRLADEEFTRVIQDSLNLEEEERQRTRELQKNDAEMTRPQERERELNNSALDEENEQLNRIIEESLKEKGKRKQFEDQLEDDKQFAMVVQESLNMEQSPRFEKNGNTSPIALLDEDEQLDKILRESLKEKGRRNQFEDQVEEDKQFAMIVQESLNMEKSPPRLVENINISPMPLLDEDEQLDKVLWECLKEKEQRKHFKDQVEEDEQFPNAAHILNPTLSICEGCNSEIEHGRSVNLLGAVWHPECFCCLTCDKPIAMQEFSNSRGRFHRLCYREHRHPNCYICKEKIPSTAKGIKYNEHPFWKDKYCPSHDIDGTAKCCSCEKLEPLGTNYVMLDDERRLCVECMECAVMDTDECHSLHIEIREFFEGLNMKIEKEFSVFLVERQALNKAEEKEKIQDHHRAVVTRGLCLAEEQIVPIVSRRPSRRGPNNQLIGIATQYQRLFRKCEVIAILILYGFPRLLTGSILAHEMMHAWLRLNGYRNLRPELEEGLCQVLGHMWLDSQTYSTADAATAIASSSSASSSYAPPAASTLKKGDPSDFERKFVEFCKNQIETDDSPIYGLGFKKVNQMVTQYSLQETLREIKVRGLK